MSDLGSEANISDVYTERNIAVSLAVKLADIAGFSAWVDKSDPEWPIVFIDLPSGQVSWHIPQNEYENMFMDLPQHAGWWDGHDTGAKNLRVAEYANK